MSSASSSAPRPRVVGVTIPLFSLRTRRSWGIGDAADVPAFASFVRSAGIGLVQVLPLGPMGAHETSPYSALSAFGIDPLYIAVDELPGAGPHLLDDEDRTRLEAARSAARVDYEVVRSLKQRALRRAYEAGGRAAASDELAAFVAASSAWLPDYALFVALKGEQSGLPWWEWPAPLRDRDANALAEARARLTEVIAWHEWLQWVAHAQWRRARAEAAAAGVELMGDLPFMVGRDSADVWANQREFRLEHSVGTPPDFFSAEGQDWGLPPYFWDRMREGDFAWLRRRARYAGALFDRFRIDHLVGFYRTYMRPLLSAPPASGRAALGPGSFDPEGEAAQIAHGERVMRAMMEAAAEEGARIVAEDLGAVPDAVRQSLARLEVPGYKVLVWERDGLAFRDPRAYPEVSVACFGTHDTDPIAAWWDAQADHDRRAAARLFPSVEAARAGHAQAHAHVHAEPHAPPHAHAHAAPDPVGPFSRDVHRSLLEVLATARSELVLLLFQDLVGTRDRINVPGTLGPHNWTWRLPQPVEDLAAQPDLVAWLGEVRAIFEAAGRAR